MGLQRSLADFEDVLHRATLRAAPADRPVFITGLPRAGTTLLLNLLATAGPFATHTYRHMPFLLTPMLWHSFARPFRTQREAVERAHGDGMRIDLDSPEAFEEVLWRAFWPGKYHADRIEAWTNSEASTDEFASFFKSHVAKIVALAKAASPENKRYLSKNNANVVRIPTLLSIFPDAVALVAFRNPADQAASMLRQHERFSAMHASEPFVRRYMADLGHYEFGLSRRPLDFGNAKDGRDPERARGSAASLDDWLAYWCAAYDHVLRVMAGAVVLVDYDALCARPAAELGRAGAAAGVNDPAALRAAARHVRPANRYEDASATMEPGLLERALRLHRRLLSARDQSG